MPTVEKIIKSMEENQKNVRFVDLVKVCTCYFSKPRIKGSHYYFSVPWEGEPLINIQNDNREAKSYQVRQVLAAIKKLEGMQNV